MSNELNTEIPQNDASVPFYAKRFVAGISATQAVEVAQELSSRGIASTLDLLGENIKEAAEVEVCAAAYIDLLEQMHNCGLPPYISIKLTMLGLDLSPQLCREKLNTVLAAADSVHGRVAFDMEGSDYTERTISLYEESAKLYKSPEIVLQAYLHRTVSDVQRVIAANGRLRLCKGAYKEPRQHALQKMKDIRRNYLELLEPLLEQADRVCIATHDDAIIEAAEKFIKGLKVGKDRYEFQMLYGLREKSWERIAKKGHNMTVYVPYGTSWQAYFARRLAERKENVFFILKNLVRS